MHGKRWSSVMIRSLLCACLLAGAGLGQARSSKSDYERLGERTGELAEKLSNLGMNELLEALTAGAKGEGGLAGKLLLAESRIAQAAAEADLDKRNAVLDEAVKLLTEVVQATSDPKTDAEFLDSIRYRIKRAEVQWSMRVEPYVLRLRYLYGGDFERKKILEYTADAPKSLAELNRTITESLERWQSEKTKLVSVVPKMEDIQQQADYSGSWVKLYRAIAMKETDPQQAGEKRQLLIEAASGAKKFTGESDSLGVRDRALLLAGIAFREGGFADPQNHELAEECLSKLTGPGTEPVFRTEAIFESARNWIEYALHDAQRKRLTADAWFDRADKEIRAYRDVSYELAPDRPEARVSADVTVALLRNYLCETRAAAAPASEKAQSHRDQAVDALLEFLQKYPDPGMQEDFLAMIAGRHEGRGDVDQLGSLVLVGLGVLASNGQGDVAEVEKLLEKAVASDDRAAKAVQPLALWRLAMIQNERGNSQAAGERFLELARKYPDYPRALSSAINAAISYSIAVDQKPDLRPKFIEVLAFLLAPDRWADRKQEKARWYFEIGWQCQKVSQEVLAAPQGQQRNDKVVEWTDRAVAAYRNVPADNPAHMEARHLALELQVALPEWIAADDARKRKMYANLPEQLDAYAALAVQAAAKATAEKQRKDLMTWAALAELRKAEVWFALGEREPVWSTLKQLPAKYPGTDVLVDATQFHIRSLIEDSQREPARLQEAIVLAEKFRQEHPDEAVPTMARVVQRIRERIHALRGDSRQVDALRKYQQAYYGFAQSLYAAAKDDERTPLTQMYAESLLEKGDLDKASNLSDDAKKHYEESLTLFQQCRDRDDKARREKAKVIEERFDKQRRAIAEAANDPAKMKELTAGFFRMLQQEYGGDGDDKARQARAQATEERLDKIRQEISAAANDPGKTKEIAAGFFEMLQQEYDLGERHLPQAFTLLQAQVALAMAMDNDRKAEVKTLLALLGTRLKQGCDMLQQIEQGGLAVDPANIHGLARAEWGLGKYTQAAEDYRKLLGPGGIRQASDPGLFWQIQFEQLRCVLEGFGGNAGAMKTLMAKCRELKAGSTNPDILDELNRIENEAAQRAGAKKGT